jgi:L-lysine 6-oxidase
MNVKIHPSVGVARLGNSPDEFYLAPDTIGGLPFDVDTNNNQQGSVTTFKDDAGLVKRQGQPFKLYQDNGTELTLDSPNVKSISWTVHLANKKAAWYQYSELSGNLMYGEENSYTNRKIPFRNPDKTGKDRQALIVDPGPRTVSGKQQSANFDAASVPNGYPSHFPPATVEYGTSITTLGSLLTDVKGRLIVLGGFGNAGGDEPLTSYGGSNTWHDDTSDGPVYCTITFSDGSPDQTLSAWVIVASPDFVPEIVNISNLSDTMFDVGVRFLNFVPQLFSQGKFNPDYIPDFKTDILPIIQRLGRYQWVANVQSMMAFSSNIFDFTDNSDTNLANRQNYFSYFRKPDAIPPGVPPSHQSQQKLFKDNFPMVPLNSGSNSVSNLTIQKFLALTETQHFFMEQWSKGLFRNEDVGFQSPIDPRDAGSVGNCVGLPMCPGIEVTWSMQNPNIYAAPYIIRHYPGNYFQNGLDPSRDECADTLGCQPGDLSKRMACPWQADFFLCTVQYINFTVPDVNKVDGKPLPPTYYSYWWPPQSPWDVLTGEISPEQQIISHNPAGVQVNYARGVNSFVQMVEHWSALGFIRDQNAKDKSFPYFVETERNNELFTYKDVPVGDISGNPKDNETTIPVYFIQEDTEKVKAVSARAARFVAHMESKDFKPIRIAAEGLPLPRSGSRNRL